MSRRVAAASTGDKLALGIVAAGVIIGAIWLVKSGKANKFFERAWPVVQDLGRTYGPPLMEAVQRHTDGQAVFRQEARAEAQTLGERIARVLAYSSEPLLAVDIAQELERPESAGPQPDGPRRTPELPSVHGGDPRPVGAGKPSGYTRGPLPPTEVWDYRARLHKDANRTWETASARSAQGRMPTDDVDDPPEVTDQFSVRVRPVTRPTGRSCGQQVSGLPGSPVTLPQLPDWIG